MAIPEHELRLIGDIYDAALDTTLWPRVMTSLADLVGARTSVITALDTLNPAYNLMLPHERLAPESMTEYREQGWDVLDMQVTGAALLQSGVGVATSSHAAYGSVEAWKARIGGYYDYLEKWGLAAQAGALLDHGDFRWSVLGIHRPSAQGVFSDDSIAVLNRLTPHLRRALQIHRQLSYLQRRNAALYAMLEKLAAAVILLDVNGRVTFANSRAEKVLGQQQLLQISRSEGLHTRHAQQNDRLQALLRGCIATGRRDAEGNAGGVIGLGSSAAGDLLLMTVTPLSALESWDELRSDDVAAAVFLSQPQEAHRLALSLLQENYGLTQREAEICEAFVNNPVLEALAPQVGLTLASLRSLFKAVYEKTGMHSQAELMRLLMGLRVNFEHIR
ncbi:MAG TPA: PAS domain-containing protein [Moraxellaceae bacterium]